MSEKDMSMTGRFTAFFQQDTSARAYADPVVEITTESAQSVLDESQCVGEDEHPAFKLVAFWHRMGVLGVDKVVHHA